MSDRPQRLSRDAFAAFRFVHAYVDRTTRRPVAIPETLRMALSELEPGSP